MENFSSAVNSSVTAGQAVNKPEITKLPDFASAMGVANYYPTPSPADSGVSGVMSPMTPMSNYTGQGSTPEQAFMTSPEHLNYAFESSEMPGKFEESPYNSSEVMPGSSESPYLQGGKSPYSSDEGCVVLSKCSQFYPQYDQHWALSNTVCYILIHIKNPRRLKYRSLKIEEAKSRLESTCCCTKTLTSFSFMQKVSCFSPAAVSEKLVDIYAVVLSVTNKTNY